jgi:hypothetical protein
VAKCPALLNWIANARVVEQAVVVRDDLAEAGMAAVAHAKAQRPTVALVGIMIEVVTTTVVATMADVQVEAMAIAAVLAAAITAGSAVQ